MTTAEFADLLSRLVGEAEDAGLARPQMIAVLEEQAQAMREAEAQAMREAEVWRVSYDCPAAPTNHFKHLVIAARPHCFPVRRMGSVWEAAWRNSPSFCQ